MEFRDTGLPPDTAEAYAYFDRRIDEAADALGLNILRREKEVYFHFRLQRRAAVIMSETGVDHDLISAFLLDSARLGRPRTEEEDAYIREKFSPGVHDAWRVMSDPELNGALRRVTDPGLPPGEKPDAREADALMAKIASAPKIFKTARMAYYAATVETLLDDEQLLLDKRKEPDADRTYVDRCRFLTDCFNGAPYALQHRLEKDFDRMDQILTRADRPPQFGL